MLQHRNRRDEPVKTLISSLSLAFLVGSVLALSGCSTDNETEAERLQKKLGAAPTTDVKGGEAPPQPRTQEEYAARQGKALSDSANTSEYAKGKGTAAGGGAAGRR
jgi:uncharacterized lipoprotein